MCGRYYIASEDSDEELRALIESLNRRDAEKAAQLSLGEMRPGMLLPAVIKDGAAALKWGFYVGGEKNESGKRSGGRLIINARAETAAEKPLFKSAFASARCLFPASLYYEWNESKERFAFNDGGRIFYMAGLWRVEDGTPSAVILTRPAIPEFSAVHDRMPLIIPKGQRRRWLMGDNPDALLSVELPPLGMARG
ncbi:MAG: SOS response-associated peptidase family protein [Eubacteriales bacterium]|nr:SOS response-associated peptidase family protein [Eubacteriales bacterium]MDD3882480.1 SOS response-associated peptidase family protein [Eubacteriales bacterium]MDD4513202.1 SOS response-associated peptidase family protein [Eubacteriales bacterium]